MDLAARLARLQLLVVTGKGGVGKTAVAASLGRLLAAAGRRVLVLEVDPRENVHQMLAVSPSGGAIVAAGPRLWVQNLKPGQVLDDIVRERLRVEMLARRVLASPIYEQFSASAPGLKELAILGHALRLLRRSGPPDAPDLDVVVLDAPATGHGVRLLAAPRLVSEVIRNGPFAALAGELAAFVADPERCGIVVVTQAEEMPVEEALELRAALASQLGREPELLIVNGLFPPLPGGLERPEIFDPLTAIDPLDPPAPPHSPAPLDPLHPIDPRRPPGPVDPPRPPPIPQTPREAELLTFWRHRRFLNERQLECLARWWEGPRLELPQLALERGPRLTAALQRLLGAGLAAAGAGAGSGPPAGGGA
ncbi:MAG TPA: ArsA family ATPase [Thermoanaerobaculia bacterium]|nr:ArsA family ATPase [Thermoanaerobaculia bacterium]